MTRDPNLTRRAALALMSASAAATALPAFAQDATEGPVVEVMTLGDPDAPITMYEYSSFTCPHCKRFHEEVLPLIQKNYIDTGKVKLVYRPIYFDRLGLWADMVARCGGQMRYFGIGKMIFEKQAEWTQGETALDIVNNLFAIGRVAGLEDADMEVCIQDAEMANALVNESTANAEADGINATPTFVINGEVFPNQAYEVFVAKFDALLAE